MHIKSIVVGSGPKLGGKQMSMKSVRLRVAPGVAVLDTAENPLTVMDYLAQEFEAVPNAAGACSVRPSAPARKSGLSADARQARAARRAARR